MAFYLNVNIYGRLKRSVRCEPFFDNEFEVEVRAGGVSAKTNNILDSGRECLLNCYWAVICKSVIEIIWDQRCCR